MMMFHVAAPDPHGMIFFSERSHHLPVTILRGDNFRALFAVGNPDGIVNLPRRTRVQQMRSEQAKKAKEICFHNISGSSKRMMNGYYGLKPWGCSLPQPQISHTLPR